MTNDFSMKAFIFSHIKSKTDVLDQQESFPPREIQRSRLFLFCNIVIFSKVATTVFNKSLEDRGKGSWHLQYQGHMPITSAQTPQLNLKNSKAAQRTLYNCKSNRKLIQVWLLVSSKKPILFKSI